jgi:hypothetical protein
VRIGTGTEECGTSALVMARSLLPGRVREWIAAEEAKLVIEGWRRR